VRVAAEVVEAKLFEDAGLAEVGDLAGAVGAADGDAALAGGVSAEDGAVVHEDDARAAACGGEGGADACHAAADDAEVCLVLHAREAVGLPGHAFSSCARVLLASMGAL
jgi:hypothetical protein